MKMKLGLLLCAPALLLAACNNGPKYEVKEETFDAVVVKYGFYAPSSNATYTFNAESSTAIEGQQPSTMTISGTVEVDGVKIHVDETMTNGGSSHHEEGYLDYTNATSDPAKYDMYGKETESDPWAKETVDFVSYANDAQSLGLYLTELKFSDFTFDSESHAYKLKENKEVTVRGTQKGTYTALSLYFENDKLLKLESTFVMTSNYGEYVVTNTATSSFVASKVGETTVTLPTVQA